MKKAKCYFLVLFGICLVVLFLFKHRQKAAVTTDTITSTLTTTSMRKTEDVNKNDNDAATIITSLDDQTRHYVVDDANKQLIDCSKVCPVQYKLDAYTSIIPPRLLYTEARGTFMSQNTIMNAADLLINWYTEKWIIDFQKDALFDLKVKCLPNPSVIAVKTDFLQQFFTEVHPKLPHPYVLITSMSDYPVPNAFKARLDDPKLLHWYGQNADTTHPKLTPIPIGLNIFEHSEALLDTYALIANGTLVDASLETKTKWLYVNFKDTTDPTGERSRLRDMACNAWKSFTDCVQHPLSLARDVITRNYREMIRYRFILSPRGNGLDCHRTWEALLLGVVPILKRTGTIDRVFHRLPVLLVDSWTEVNKSMLESNYQRIQRLKQAKHYDYSSLYVEHWMKLIFKRHVIDKSSKVYRFKCWKPPSS